jgi:chromosome segregation ATPase
MTESIEEHSSKCSNHDISHAGDVCEPNDDLKTSFKDYGAAETDLTNSDNVKSKGSDVSTTESANRLSDGVQNQNVNLSTATSNQASQQSKLSLEQQLNKVKRDLESMVIKYAKSESENLMNKAKSEELDRKLKRAIKDNESLANRIKILTNDKNQLTDTLSAKVAQLTVLEQKNCSLNNVQNVKLKELEVELEQLRKTNEELLKSIDTYKSKENELLDFSERLSMKQLLLQAELDKALEHSPDYKKEYDRLVLENNDLNQKVEELTERCRSSEESLANERKLVEKLRTEQSQLELKCQRNIEEIDNEMKVLKRKYQITTKELLKQVKCLQMALDAMNDTQNVSGIISR